MSVGFQIKTKSKLIQNLPLLVGVKLMIGSQQRHLAVIFAVDRFSNRGQTLARGSLRDFFSVLPPMCTGGRGGGVNFYWICVDLLVFLLTIRKKHLWHLRSIRKSWVSDSIEIPWQASRPPCLLRPYFVSVKWSLLLFIVIVFSFMCLEFSVKCLLFIVYCLLLSAWSLVCRYVPQWQPWDWMGTGETWEKYLHLKSI